MNDGWMDGWMSPGCLLFLTKRKQSSHDDLDVDRTPEREGGDEADKQASKQAINQSNRIEAICDKVFVFSSRSVLRFMYGMKSWEVVCFIPWLWIDGWESE
jgi:hypothetical protein